MSNSSRLIDWRRLWNSSLHRFIGRRVRARVDIEDLAQETYLRLLRARDLGDVRNPKAYLLRVASNVVSEWRDHQPPPAMFEAVDESSLVDESVPVFELEAQLSQARMDQVLQELPPLTRAVLLLRFRDRRRCRDIARELELTERQVRRHLTRAYEQLRGALKS